MATSHGHTNHLTGSLRVGDLCQAIAAGEIRPRQRDGSYYIRVRDIERLEEARRERGASEVPDLPDLSDFCEFHDLPDGAELHVSSLA